MLCSNWQYINLYQICYDVWGIGALNKVEQYLPERTEMIKLHWMMRIKGIGKPGQKK